MGQKNGKRLSSSTGYQKDLIADYAEGVAQKRGHYLKVIKEINKFSPKVIYFCNQDIKRAHSRLCEAENGRRM